MRMLKDVSFMLRRTAVKSVFLLPTNESHCVQTNSKRLQIQIINACRIADREEIQSLSTDRTSLSGL